MRYSILLAISLSLLLLSVRVSFAQTITTGTVTASPYCTGQTVSIPYTRTGTFTAGNIFTAQLSNELGSFSIPTNIGSLASVNNGTITGTIPISAAPGTQYRIRVISSTPAIVGSSNPVDLTILNPVGDPLVFGDGVWNAYCYNTSSYDNSVFNLSNYRGYYTQTGLSFNSTNLWAVGSNPSTAVGYSGCTVTDNLNIVQYKRRNFPCGYYQINIANPGGPGNTAGNDDAAKLFIDGVLVWSTTGCCAVTNNVWQGFLGPTSEIEFIWAENSGDSYGRLTFVALTRPLLAPTVSSICVGSSVTLTASGMSNYDWSTNTTHVNPPYNTNTITVSPALSTPNSTEVYTVTTTDPLTGCQVSNTASVTINAPTGDPAVFGNFSWNVYCYNTASYNNTTFDYSDYKGSYVHNGLNFNSTDLWGINSNPGTAPGYIGCTVTNDLHNVRYKRKGFDCGYYRINVAGPGNIAGHDDAAKLIINGITVWQSTGCCNAIPNAWQGYLGADTEIEFSWAENGGGSYGRLTFDYLYGPQNSANESVWVGSIDNDWFKSGNWCNNVPNSVIGAYIPSNTSNLPVVINASAATRLLFIQQGAALTINGTNRLDVYGNFIKNGTFTPNNSTVSFKGSNSINISSTTSNLTFSSLEIDTSTPTGVQLGTLFNSQVIISQNVNFINGIVNAGATNLFVFNDDASSTGANNNSYVDGQVRKIGNDAFTFPVGNGGFYAPISISAPTNTTHHFTARYFFTNPNTLYNVSLRDPSLDHISGAEYWLLNRTNGASQVFVTLSWDARSGGVTNLADLRIARWNGAQWTNSGNGGTTGNTTSGTVRSLAVLNAFGPFSLSTATFENPLPIELISFRAKWNIENFVKLEWITASESNNDFFTVERSQDGKVFTEIIKMKGEGTTNHSTNYEAIDDNPYKGVNYYRLKQTDYDGTTENLKVIYFETPINQEPAYSVYPNPLLTNTFTFIGRNLEIESELKITLFNNIGQKIEGWTFATTNYGAIKQDIELQNNLTSGTYYLKINNSQKSEVIKLFVTQSTE